MTSQLERESAQTARDGQGATTRGELRFGSLAPRFRGWRLRKRSASHAAPAGDGSGVGHPKNVHQPRPLALKSTYRCTGI